MKALRNVRPARGEILVTAIENLEKIWRCSAYCKLHLLHLRPRWAVFHDCLGAQNYRQHSHLDCRHWSPRFPWNHLLLTFFQSISEHVNSYHRKRVLSPTNIHMILQSHPVASQEVLPVTELHAENRFWWYLLYFNTSFLSQCAHKETDLPSCIQALHYVACKCALLQLSRSSQKKILLSWQPNERTNSGPAIGDQ